MQEISEMRKKILIAAAIVTLAVVAAPLAAHHAFSAEFDADRPVHLEGTVTKMGWINPHSWVHLAVTKEDGTIENWMVEGGTPNTLFRRGFTAQQALTVIIADPQLRRAAFFHPDAIAAVLVLIQKDIRSHRLHMDVLKVSARLGI